MQWVRPEACMKQTANLRTTTFHVNIDNKPRYVIECCAVSIPIPCETIKEIQRIIHAIPLDLR